MTLPRRSWGWVKYLIKFRLWSSNQQIGAGVIGGAALLAGGVFAYKKHEEHKEEVYLI